MLAVSVEFLHGTFRGDPDGTAKTAGLSHGEWPPAPFRLFAALVAADGTRDACKVSTGIEMTWFERLPAPTIRADAEPWHQFLQPRYIALHKGSAVKKTHQEYMGRQGTVIRPGYRVSTRQPRVVYTWDATPSSDTLDALRLRAARVGYLGCADSPARIRVMTEQPEPTPGDQVFEPVPGGQGDLAINVPAPGDLQRLDTLYDLWRVHGADIGRGHFPSLRHEASYLAPKSAPRRERGEIVAWLRIESPLSGRRLTTVTQIFKQAVLSKHQEIHGEPPPVLHGHGFAGSGYELARFLALPDVGFRRSRGRIHGLALWMPPGSDTVQCLRARYAASAVRRISGAGINASVAPRSDEARPLAANPARWCAESQAWATAFPAIHERRGSLDLDEVARWCRHAGLPEPSSFRSARGPLVHGAVDLAPVEVNRPGRPGRPYSHVEVRFPQPVRGPVVIGAGRQRGFGLCVPVTC